EPCGDAPIFKPALPSRKAVSAVEQPDKPFQVKRPAALPADSVAHRVPAGAVTLELAVFKLDTGALGTLGNEADLDLAGLRRIRLELPARVDVPADHHAV